MASVKMCDTVGCGNLVEHDHENFVMEALEGKLVVMLAGGESVDRCEVCEKKARAKLARKAWDFLKRKSGEGKKKEEGNDE